MIMILKSFDGREKERGVGGLKIQTWILDHEGDLNLALCHSTSLAASTNHKGTSQPARCPRSGFVSIHCTGPASELVLNWFQIDIYSVS